MAPHGSPLRFLGRKLLAVAAPVVLVVACSKSPAGPSPGPTPPVPTPVTLAACSTWSATQQGSGVAPATGEVVAQRAAFLSAGGGIKAVNGKYYAMLFPSSWASSSTRRVFVDLHGTGGAPETEWSTDWKDIVSARGYAYLGLKYVSATGVHDDEATIYANLKTMVDDIKASCDFGSPSMLLQGFSRGSAESFPIAYLDLKDRRLFKAFANNSGAWVIGEPMTETMQGVASRNETTAYNGAKFWMYCGGLDTGHGYPMCDEMKNARTTIEKYGGTVARLFEDPFGGHGGLAKNTSAWMELFSYFEGL